MARKDDYGYGLEYEPVAEPNDEHWDRRSDYGYGLEYEPADDTPPSYPPVPQPPDDPIGDPAEEAYEAAWRAGLINRDNASPKGWRRQS